MNFKFLIFLLAFPLLTSAALPTPTAYIQWQQPGFNVDGTEFPIEEIEKFTVHYGMMSGVYNYQYDIPAGVREAYVPLPYAGTWYIAATVTNIYSETSEYSNEVVRTATDAPFRKIKPPTLRLVRAIKIVE